MILTLLTGGGEPYIEYANPLERFQAIPIVDSDDDGFAELVSLPYDNHTWSQLDPHSIGDARISTEMLRHGFTSSDIKAQLHLLLSGHANYTSDLQNATDRVDAGRYQDAVTGLLTTNTGATDIVFIRLYCGTTSLDWVIGVPTVLDCHGDLVLDLSVLPLATWVYPYIRGGAVEDIDIELTSIGINPLHTGQSFLGATYNDQGFGVYTSLQRTLQFEGQFRSLIFSPSVFDLWIRAITGGDFGISSRIYYASGDTMMDGNVIYLESSRVFNNLHLNAEATVTSASNWEAKITIDAMWLFEYAKIELVEPAKRIEAHLLAKVDLPKSFTIGFKKFNDGKAGEKMDIKLLSHVGSLRDLEIQGTIHVYGKADLDIALVGLPDVNTLRLKLDNSANGVTSLDLARDEPTSTTDNLRYRSFSIDGKAKSRAVQLTGQDFMRGRIVIAEKDFADGDQDAMAELGAYFALSTGKLNAKAKESWIKQFNSLLQRSTSSSYTWAIGPPPTCTVACTGSISLGETKKSDSIAFNAYYRALKRDQFEPTWCVAKYSDGTCG